MADPIMDLFDDTPLFNLDSLPEDAFSQGSSDPVEEALKLALGHVDPPMDPTPDPGVPVLSDVVTDRALIPTPLTAPVSVPLQTLQTQQPTQMCHEVSVAPASISIQPSLSLASNSSGAATVLLSSPLGVPVSVATQQLQTQQITVTQQAGGQSAPKILILKGPQGQTQVLQGVTGATGSPGKVTLARVLTGTPLRPGMAVVSGGTVLNATSPGQGQVKVGTGVQRLVHTPNGPMKQVLLTSVPQTQSQDQAPATTSPGTTAAAVRPQGNLNSPFISIQGEAKRITLVLQQPSQGGAQHRLVLGSLPGKLVLQGGQLAALAQAKAGQTGAQPKVLTIQLQVQQQPNQQGAKVSERTGRFQLVSGAANAGGSPQVVQISQGQGGQRLAVPLKLLLQPQVGQSIAGGAVSVVKVISTSAAGSASCTTTTVSSSGVRLAKVQEPVRRVETLCKQEKANRIVAEAIARAKARGERNIPRVLNQDELPAGQTSADLEGATGAGGAKKKGGGSGCGGSKKKSPCAVGGKKRKRNASSDHSDIDLSPPVSPRTLEEEMSQKRRSNRQVKRKKYTEDLDIKITDDEDEMDADVDVTTTPVSSAGHLQSMGAELHQELDGDGLPSMQFFVENPSEEDAAIVDKILSMRVTKKEVSPGQYTNMEEFFVKYKNYSYMHCEWASLEQLERDKRIHQKLKRFKTKQAQMRNIFQEDEEPFNPDYVEVDRILDESHSVDKDNGEPVVYYLVKWCSLPYEDATWELKEDVDEAKVEEFRKIESRPARLKRTPRPAASAWKKLDESREYMNGNQLREYQLEGVNWLLFNWYNRQNCILADEMGLGKTIQSLALLSEVFAAGVQGPFLIIAPLSTITNWEREFSTWTDMNAIVYHGSLASRQMIQQYEMYCKDDKGHLIPGAYKFDALITTFEMILSDCPELREISWRCVVIDEAHRLKNRNCKLLDSLKMLDPEHKVLLTGTPLQNTVEELFSLLHFLEPTQFPSEIEFLREFGDLKTEEQVQKLQSILKPMMLRRLKEDVEKNLAPKQETIIEVELTDVQKKYYRAILERNFSFLSMGATQNSNVPNLLNTMMELRKCCNHPYLITGAEEKIVAELREVYDPLAPDFHLQALVRSAGKLVLLDKLLPRLKAGGHKVLIFSQMVRCLDILEDYLIHKRYLYERIDGRVRGNLRQAAIDRFSKPDSDRFVFLLCTRAGGLGINLTAADTCVIFDSDWNPQNDLQAQARCHRIGQSKAVKVYRLITRNSYEREMLDKASLKLGLDRAVLQSMSGNKDSSVNGIQQFSKKEIEDLLRKGAYAAIMDENDEGSRFCEEDIDQILQRRATTITIESEGKGSTFSKASFVASENRTDIALDDPEFWQKWAKKADIDMDSLNRKNTLVIDTPRVRKQTRQYSSLRGEGGDLSDLDSDDDYPPHNSRPSRASRRSDRHSGGGYGRTDCFRVEKHLLVYGWGRWRDILSHARCKRRLSESDVETICRVILVFCLIHYRGDENIKSFIWELITPPENGREPQALLNHSVLIMVLSFPLGLSIPVPRGRKGKRVKAQSSFDVQKVEWIRKYNPDSLLLDDSYRKHLKHQCNKVLLRVRMLYYLKQEVIGEHADSVLSGADARDIDIWLPEMEQQDVPSGWWDAEADRCLLIGVYKHGYEMYTTMRADPCLCFVEQCGRPNEQDINAEQQAADPELGEGGDYDKYSEDPEFKPASRHTKEVYEEADSVNTDGEICVEDHSAPVQVEGPSSGSSDLCYWPTSSSLTARLRRLITAYQRSYRREQLKMEAAEKGDRKRRRCEQATKLKEIARQERQQRWTRREECDFYRVVSTFGVERIKKEADAPEGDEHHMDWNRFRSFARLDKKSDESLTRYFKCFMSMCRKVCHLRPARGEEYQDLSQSLAPITEERASRTLYRVSLLCRLRERVLPHPSLEERLSLAPLSSDLPNWWSIPQHDHELLLAADRHGVSRTELSIFSDPQYSFIQARLDYLQNQQAQAALQIHTLSQSQDPTSIKEESLDDESRLLGVEALCPSDSPALLLTHSEGKVGVQAGWSWKKSKNNGPSERKGGRERGEGPSDSDSDSDSGSSSSSRHSGSSDDSGDSDAEREQAALKMCDGDEENSILSLTPSQEGAPPESLTDPLRVDWPKDRVLINRIDNLCSLVLKGHWPSGRRYVSDIQLNATAEEHDLGDGLGYPRVARKSNTAVSAEGFLPESLFHRLLSPHASIPKKSRHYLSTPSMQINDPLLGGGEGETLVSDGAYMMDDEDLEDGSHLTSSHHFLTPTYDVKMEPSALDLDGGDSLSQGGYDSSDREAILDDVIMAPKNSDSSSSSED
uniref:Chromodomain-helicase-DNA-binding protein 8 n=1 Tax=Sinocyclocheilus grahami TaxID=75366 RepID=A0A672R4L7_SINGR